MPALRNTKLTIGGPEGTPGTAVARTEVIPIDGLVDLDRNVDTQDDPSLQGTLMSRGAYPVSDDVGGGIPVAFRPVAGVGMLMKSLFGLESAPVRAVGCMRIRYTGASASCKIVADNTSHTLKAYVGTLGSESADASFGTAGSIDLTNASFDTLTELVAAVDGYASYDAELLSGAVGVLTTNIITKTTQAAGGWCYIYFTNASGSIYGRNFTMDLSAASDIKPVYSIQKDGYGDNFLYAGGQVDEFTLSGRLKSMLKASAKILAFTELGGQSASVVTLDDSDPMMFWNGSTALGAVTFPYVRDFSITFKNNFNPDGSGQGAIGRQYHQKGMVDITGTITLKIDANSIARRADIFNAAFTRLSFVFKGRSLGSSQTELVVLEFPVVRLTDAKPVESNGQLDISYNFRVHNPGTQWDAPATMTWWNTDSAAY